ncbi:hypothetical protein GC197_17280 [bacterium]|nr:hypothetical protein [bacterium]
MTESAPESTLHRWLRIPLWGWVFVVPAIVSIACTYYSITYGLPRQIEILKVKLLVAGQTIQQKSEELPPMEHQLADIESKIAEFKTADSVVQHVGKQKYLRDMGGEWDNSHEMRYFTRFATDDQLQRLMTLWEKQIDTAPGYMKGRILVMLPDVLEQVRERRDVVDDQVLVIFEKLLNDPDKSIAKQAGVVRQICFPTIDQEVGDE